MSCFCRSVTLPPVEVKKCQEKAQLALASTPAVTRKHFFGAAVPKNDDSRKRRSETVRLSFYVGALWRKVVQVN